MTSKLAIIDWGIGGLGIYKLVKDGLGDVPVIYFSDTGATPYGKMGRRELVSRLDKVVAFLKSEGVTHLVIGCNAASTALPYLHSDGVTIAGVIESAIEAALAQKPDRLGLIGGRRTVLSRVYKNAFAGHRVAVKQRIAQPLSGLIENGDTGSEKLRDNCRRILTPLKNCSHILLACTHYAAITPVMADHVSTRTEFIDPAAELLKTIEEWRLDAAGGPDRFFTSGSADSMRRGSAAAFGVTIGEIRQVRTLT